MVTVLITLDWGTKALRVWAINDMYIAINSSLETYVMRFL